MRTVKTFSRCLPAISLSGWVVLLCVLVGHSVCSQSPVVGIRENLGEGINNTYDQIAPIFSKTALRMYYAQNSHAGGYYEVWEATMDSAGGWSQARRKEGLRTRETYNQTVFGAYDNDWLLINGTFPLQNGVRTYVKGFSWYRPGSSIFEPEKAIPLQIDGFPELLKAGFANVFYHPQRKVLLLSLPNPDKRDLFIAFPKDTTRWPITQWKRPIPLPGVNSTFEESCPFLDDSGQVLYFSSNRPGGYGSDDIYVSHALSEDLLQWSAPVNLGFGVNSNFSELYFTTYSHYEYAYFVSYKHSMGAGDIFRIRRNDTLQLPPLITQSPVAPLPSLDVPQTPPAAVPPPPVFTVQPGQLAQEKYAPNNIVFLLDKSQSMAQGGRMPMLRKSTRLLVNKLRYLDKVSLITFGEKTNLLYASPQFLGADTLIRIIDKVIPDEGETYINDGMHKAVQHALDYFIEKGNNEIFVVTDGYFSISNRTVALLNEHPRIRITFVLVDAGSIEANIKQYVHRQLPGAQVLTLGAQAKDEAKLLETIMLHSLKE